MENLSRLIQDTSEAFNSSGYAFFNIEAHIFCALILGILFFRQQNFSDQKEVRIIWSRIIFAQFLYCLAKIFRVLVDVNIINNSPFMQYIAAFINFVLFGLISWLVFIYSELYQDSKMFDSLKNKIISCLPVAFNIIMLLLTPFTSLYLDIYGPVMKEGALFPVMLILDLLYPAAALILVFSRGRINNKYDIAAIYPALFLICGPVQLLSPRVPFLCFAMIIADMLVYISYVDSLISIDPLTKISNRNGFIRDLTHKFMTGERENLHLFAIDIEDLSAINSRFGRLEGDRALIITAQALKNFSEHEYTCYIARYYGDEFMITANINNNEIEIFTERVRNYISNEAAKNKLKFFLRVNIGFAKYENYSRSETISGLINESVRSLNEAREQRRFNSAWPGVKK